MAHTPLLSSTPSAQGTDAQGIEAFIDALEATPGIDMHSLIVVRHGAVVAAGWWAPYTPDRLQLLYSLSKSYTSTAAGLAVEDGLLNLDDPVIRYFPELDADVTHPWSRAMLVRHIASMASGHTYDTWDAVVASGDEEPVRAFLRLAPEQEPGTVFAYNQSATYTLAAIVQRVSGQSLTGYLRRRLLDALGVGPVAWQRDPGGRELGFSGLHATTETIARLGLLYLQRGNWQGRQLLASDWVAEATRPHIGTASWGERPDIPPTPDWGQGYGYQFWMARHGYRGDGAYGQYCVVLPEHDTVVAITSQTPDMQAVLEAAWEHLLPALAAGGTTAADARLEARLAHLEVPRPSLAAAPPGQAEEWADVMFKPEGGYCAAQPTLQAVKVTREGPGWRVSLEEAGGQLAMSLGHDAWVVTEGPVPSGGTLPLACAGGWEGSSRLRAEVIFLETPHRLVLTCELGDRSFRAEWATAPLHAPALCELRAPRSAG